MALDNVAAHYLPMPGEDIIFSNQIVKLDLGVSYHGAIGDCAVTIDLSGQHQKLVEASEAALAAAQSIIKVGLPIREIGKAIEKTILSFGFQPVRNLCGHGLGKYRVHAPPSIPNCDDHSTGVIKAGMTFAIEPFATSGKGLIYENGTATIFSYKAPRPLRTDVARAVLAKIKIYEGLPLAMQDLIDSALPLSQVQEGLQELQKAGVIMGHPPLLVVN